MQSARLRVGRGADLQFREPAGGNFISSTLANHLKPSVADGLLFVAASSGQVCAPREIVRQRGRTWQDPASTSLRALERHKTCASFTKQQSLCRKRCSCRTLPSEFLPLPPAEGAKVAVSMAVQDRARAVKLLAKGVAQAKQNKCSFPIFFTQALLAPELEFHKWHCPSEYVLECLKPLKNGICEGVSSTYNQAPV